MFLNLRIRKARYKFARKGSTTFGATKWTKRANSKTNSVLCLLNIDRCGHQYDYQWGPLLTKYLKHDARASPCCQKRWRGGLCCQMFHNHAVGVNGISPDTGCMYMWGHAQDLRIAATDSTHTASPHDLCPTPHTVKSLSLSCRCCRNHWEESAGLQPFTEWNSKIECGPLALHWEESAGLRPFTEWNSELECGLSALHWVDSEIRWNKFF